MMMMKMICAWCGKILGEKDGKGVEGISHCVCEECLHRFQAEMDLRVSWGNTGRELG